MIVIYGQKSYGKVDRVPGVCYVLTTFAHLNFIPLFPLRSYIVIEGTESGGEFRGKEISTCLRSAVAGYVRVWFGALAVIAGVFAGVELNRAIDPLRLNGLVFVGLIATGAGGLLSLFIRGKIGGGMQVATHLISAVLWVAFYNAAGQNRRVADSLDEGLLALALANVGLLLYGLTRLMDHANPARTRDLLRQLGVELPSADDEDDTPQEKRWEEWDESENRRTRGRRYE